MTNFAAPYDIRIEDREVATIVHVRGDIDSVVVPQLHAAIALVAQSGRPMVISLSEVTYIGMSGFRGLAAAKRALMPSQPMVLVASLPHVHRIIDIIRFSELIPVYDTIDAALDGITGLGTGETQ